MTKPPLDANTGAPASVAGASGSVAGHEGLFVARETMISVAKSPSTSQMTGSSWPVPEDAGALKRTLPVGPS